MFHEHFSFRRLFRWFFRRFSVWSKVDKHFHGISSSFRFDDPLNQSESDFQTVNKPTWKPFWTDFPKWHSSQILKRPTIEWCAYLSFQKNSLLFSGTNGDWVRKDWKLAWVSPEKKRRSALSLESISKIWFT